MPEPVMLYEERRSVAIGTFFYGVTRHTEEAYQWVESCETKGCREVSAERDARAVTTALGNTGDGHEPHHRSRQGRTGDRHCPHLR